MKKPTGLILISFILLQLFVSTSIDGQVTAGDIPPGTSVIYSPVEFSITENEHDTTTYLDLDADGIEDVRIWFFKGNTPSDAPNMAIFFALGNTFSFCNVSDQPVRVALYSLGDTLCFNGGVWGVDSVYTAGCYGGWGCKHDESPVIDEYIAYKKISTGEVGWLKVSMSLYAQVDQIPVTFSISEMLVLALQSGVNEQSNSTNYEIVPNPTSDGYFSIKGIDEFESIDIFNASGQNISNGLNSSSQFCLPDEQGLYMVRIRDSKGLYSIQKVLRL